MTITVACVGIVVIMVISILSILFAFFYNWTHVNTEDGFAGSMLISNFFLGGCITYILWLQGYIK